MPCNEGDIKSKFLTIRWSDGTGGSPVDDGTRPLPDPTAYWESPDLWLSGGIDKAKAKVGVPNQIWARVYNFGPKPVTGINVEVWVCNFMLGVNPASSLPSSNPGNAPMTGFYPGTVNSGSSADIQVSGAPMPCPPPSGPTTTDWCPTGADAGTNGGHVCMAGNCYGDNNDSGASFTGTDMKFLCNCHHGQRNIAVVAVPMGQMHHFQFDMFAANPEPQRVLETVVTMRRVQIDIDKDFDPKLRRLLLDSPHAVAGATAEAVNLAPDLGGGLLRPATLSPALIGFRRPGGVIDPGTPLKLTLRPHQQELIEAHVQFSPRERPGSVHAFDLVEHETTGAIVGGARLITILTP